LRLTLWLPQHRTSAQMFQFWRRLSNAHLMPPRAECGASCGPMASRTWFGPGR